MKKRTKCYIYTRVSTSMQVDGYSLDAQKDKLRKYAEYEDMTIVGEYSDEGFSGKNIQGRLEFQRMLNDIPEGKDDVSFVLVFKLSRFGRNAADVLNFFTADAGFWCQPDLCGGWHRFFQRFRQADDLRPFCCGGN